MKRAMPAPRGKPLSKAGIKFQKICNSPLRNTLRVRYETGDARPPKGEGFIIGNDYIKTARIYKFTAIFLLK